MPEELKSYPHYTNVEVSWIEKIPIHWELRKLRSVLKPISKKNRPDLPLLSVVREKGVILRDISDVEENHNYIPDDLSNYKVVSAGQFAMNKMKAWQGSYGISKYDGIVSPAYFVFNLNAVEPEFFHIATRSKAYVPFFAKASDGIRVGQWDLNQDRMKEIPFWIPSSEEQQKICRYINWKTTKINKLIKAKKQMIELLTAKKHVIVNDIITGKIDVRTGKPYLKYKASDIDWLPKIPEGWDIKKLRSILVQRTVKNRPTSTLLSVVREKGVIVRDLTDFEENHNYIPDDLSTYKYVRKGQFAMNKMKAWQGSYGVSEYEGIVSPAYFVFDIAFDNLEFFNYAIRSRFYVDFFAKSSDGIRIGQWDLSLQKMKEIPFLIPSDIEQAVIVKFIPEAFQKIESSVNKITSEIRLIQEYQTCLISNVVTGKVDVSNLMIPDHETENIDTDLEEIAQDDNDEMIMTR